jgi:hypothetical protein
LAQCIPEIFIPVLFDSSIQSLIEFKTSAYDSVKLRLLNRVNWEKERRCFEAGKVVLPFR